MVTVLTRLFAVYCYECGVEKNTKDEHRLFCILRYLSPALAQVMPLATSARIVKTVEAVFR
jgi:hypothetical protein